MKVSRKSPVKAKSPSRPVSETARLLREARALISDPKHWVKYRLAVDEHGSYVAPKRAFKLCARGAIMAVCSGDFNTRIRKWKPLDRLIDLAANKMGHPNAVCLNNTTDHKTTLKMFTLAAKLAEQEDRAKRKSPLKEKGRDNHAK